MKPTIEILTKLQENSKKHHDEVFTRLYRYLLRPDIYSISYQHLYSNEGAGTKGVDEDTADGFSEEYVERIIEALRTETYRPKPVRRSYIQKSNGKMRPLGLPTFTDKLVQEVMRMILEAVYEPVFSNYSHGFRPGRSCHTALSQLKHEFIGAGWFVEGDIKGCFDNIDHTVLIAVIGRKIKDARFLKLIRLFLKSGYMEDWKYYGTYSGCPQGGIISPILANIYLNELDSYIEELKKEFDVRTPYRTTPAYHAIERKRANLRRKIDRREAGPERDLLIAEYKKLTSELYKTPAKLCDDKKLKYVRYADDFLIAVNGSKQDCEWIKAKLTEFIQNTLKMELSQEKTLITHSNTPARFLGYDVRVRRDQQRPHGHTDNGGLEPQAEKRPQVHALQGGFQLRQHIRRDVRGALDEPARLGDHGLRHIEHRHHDMKGVGQNENGTSRLEHPFIDIRHIKLVHIVFFQKHLNQLIGGNKGQHHPGDG